MAGSRPPGQQQNHHHDAENAREAVTPAGAARPGGKRSDACQYQNDAEDCAKAHDDARHDCLLFCLRPMSWLRLAARYRGVPKPESTPTHLTATGTGRVALVPSWLMRLQLGFPDTFDFITAEAYCQFDTMRGMILVAHPLAALFPGGFGNDLIPLVVGARDMVFPIINMLGCRMAVWPIVIIGALSFVVWAHHRRSAA